MDQYFDSEEAIASNGAFSDWKDRLMRQYHFRYLSTLETAFKRFSPGERLALYLLITLLSLATLVLVEHVDTMVSVVVPVQGGALIEGETGPARFINPLLANSQADQDLSALVYSGLMRALPDGSIVPDLAKSYQISSDGRTYTFTLRLGATFQNGTTLTAADVLFTIQEAQDSSINSPRRADWTGVAVSSPDPETIVFTLPHAYAPFIEDTTLGILPKSLWQNVSAEEFPFSPLNTRPVGSGPYKISNVATDSTGAATRYDLVPFSNYTLGAPYLSRISFVFFGSEQDMLKALNNGQINAIAGISPSDVASVKSKTTSLIKVPLPRVFGVFFNQSHNDVLTDASVRAALDAATDKPGIVTESLSGGGTVLNGPIPPGVVGNTSAATPQPLSAVAFATSSPSQPSSQSTLAAAARTILQKGGWTFNESTGSWTKNKKTLAFTLATADQPELVASANALAADWKAAGINVTVQVYPLAQLNTNVIRPRAYDALLFGEVVGPELDLYAFWHSSQRMDPGLNLAMYANSKTDALLSQARATTDSDTRGTLYQQFASLLVKDTPAVFLYAPDFLYAVPQNVQGIQIGSLASPAGRFANVYQWYTDTEYVWSIFAPAQNSI
jgi:peptide/nickel transport system substrate-binding protein